jgi:hypothetical protein
LKAFFSPGEVEQLHTLARVGAYITSRPSEAPVLGNPNMAWAGSMLTKLPGMPMAGSLLAALGRTAKQSSDVSRSLSDKVPMKAAELPPEVSGRLAQLLSASGLGSGALAAESIR